MNDKKGQVQTGHPRKNVIIISCMHVFYTIYIWRGFGSTIICYLFAVDFMWNNFFTTVQSEDNKSLVCRYIFFVFAGNLLWRFMIWFIRFAVVFVGDSVVEFDSINRLKFRDLYEWMCVRWGLVVNMVVLRWNRSNCVSGVKFEFLKFSVI
jgi:hypothetical protein